MSQIFSYYKKKEIFFSFSLDKKNLAHYFETIRLGNLILNRNLIVGRNIIT
jgi:hypothetical protein